MRTASAVRYPGRTDPDFGLLTPSLSLIDSCASGTAGAARVFLHNTASACDA